MRLIDADALKTRLGQIFEEVNKNYQGLDLAQKILSIEKERILNNVLYTEIDKEPTVQTWVTCEERLPEMEVTCDDSGFKVYRSEPVIVQTKREEIFLAICKKTERKDSRRRDSVDWYTYGTGGRKMKVVSKVVAWMPKPEPWKGETK